LLREIAGGSDLRFDCASVRVVGTPLSVTVRASIWNAGARWSDRLLTSALERLPATRRRRCCRQRPGASGALGFPLDPHAQVPSAAVSFRRSVHFAVIIIEY